MFDNLEVNIDRLNDLLEVLYEVEESGRAFDIGTWINGCGTVACACGWAALDERFKDSPIGKKTYKSINSNGRVIVDYGWRWETVRTTFGLNRNTANYLFYGEMYPEGEDGISYVIARIEDFVEYIEKDV